MGQRHASAEMFMNESIERAYVSPGLAFFSLGQSLAMLGEKLLFN